MERCQLTVSDVACDGDAAARYDATVVSDRNARSSPRITRVFPVTVNFALDLMSLELLPALTSTGPDSMTNSPVIPV
jgi:hypothetical protein